MGFFEDISRDYGHETTKYLKIWSTTNNKMASAVNRRIFLLECRRQGIIPKHITSNLKSVMSLFDYDNNRLNKKIKQFNDKTIKKILNLELSQVNQKVNKLKKYTDEISRKLQNLPENILVEYKRRINIAYNKKFHKIKEDNLKKIRNLSRDNIQYIKTQEKWIKNLSKKPIPKTVQNLLSLGSKFNVPTTKKDVNVKNLIADTEYILQGVQSEQKNIKRARVTNIITNYLHKNVDNKNPTNEWFRETKEFLKNNDDLVVLNSDKGGTTVIMDHQIYKEKMKTILHSKDFKKLSRDPTESIQKKCNSYIETLKRKKYITPKQAKEMKTYNGVAPKIYGNPKLHKEGHPLRPIISGVDSPVNSLSKFMADALKSAYNTDNRYYVKDTFQYAQEINDFEIPDDHRLISLDVVNLFGNLEKKKIIEILKLKWENIRPHTNLDMNLFMEIITFLLENNYCTFQGEFYQQIFGCAMGSKLSPILAQYVMDHQLDSILPKLPYTVLFVKKFVDDIMMIVPETFIQLTLDLFNSVCVDLQFTLETEDLHHSVPFLDTRAYRQDKIVKLKWYRKDTHSDKIIHFHSDHGINVKINTINQMKRRISKICHKSFIDEGLKKLHQILKENDYPNSMIKKLLYANGTTQNEQTEEQNMTTDRTHYASYPNVTNLTGKLKNVFREENIKIAVQNQKTVRSLYTKIKDPIPTSFQSNVVYKIKCETCDKCYIGHTSQWLKSRVALHRSDIRKYPERCALAAHAHNLDHHVNFEGVEVLKTERNYQKRLIHEMININKEDETINKKTDTNKLSSIYSYLLERIKMEPFYDGPIDE